MLAVAAKGEGGEGGLAGGAGGGEGVGSVKVRWSTEVGRPLRAASRCRSGVPR